MEEEHREKALGKKGVPTLWKENQRKAADNPDRRLQAALRSPRPAHRSTPWNQVSALTCADFVTFH